MYPKKSHRTVVSSNVTTAVVQWLQKGHCNHEDCKFKAHPGHGINTVVSFRSLGNFAYHNQPQPIFPQMSTDTVGRVPMISRPGEWVQLQLFALRKPCLSTGHVCLHCFLGLGRCRFLFNFHCIEHVLETCPFYLWLS